MDRETYETEPIEFFLDEKFITLRRGKSKPIESKPKHVSIHKSGNCPICSNVYIGH
jgi:hypothetical protein